jgi:hypothetical protein
MAKQKATPLPLDVQLKNLQKNAQDLQDRINIVNAGLLNQTQVGADAFFAKTSEKKLELQTTPEYATEFNKAYESFKKVNFTVGDSLNSNQQKEKAFYVFDANREAKRIVETKQDVVKENNAEYAAQQERINQFVSTGAEKENKAILDNYLNNLVNKQTNFTNKTIDSTDASFSMDTWKKTAWRNKSFTYQSDPSYRGRYVAKPIYSYKISDEENQKRIDLFKQMETTRYNSTKTIQQEAIKTYNDSLSSQKKTVDSQIAALQKKINAANKPKK